MLKVLVVGQTPPPYGGVHIMIQRFVNTRYDDVQLLHVRMGFNEKMDSVGRVQIKKVFHMLAVIARIYYHRLFKGVRIMYYPPGGPDRVPMIRDIAVLLSTRWLFSKTIFHFHAGGTSELYDKLPGWQRWFFRKAYFGTDAAIRLSALTPEDGKIMQTKREYLVPNGIDDPCPNIVLPRPQEAITPDRPLRILFVGIIRESKGALVLIEACGKLAARGIPFRVEIMGQPHSEEFATHLRKRIDELNLNEHVHFLGMLTGDIKFEAYARADVFCFPSFFNCEAFPLVLLEAMAHGLPVVSTNWRGIPSIVDEGETGFLVDTHDADGVANRLEILAGDSQLRECMALAARTKFLGEFTWKLHAARMRQVLVETAGVSAREERKVVHEHRTHTKPIVASSQTSSHELAEVSGK
jgi:glycosyltransferase involved in cell wall biosynthesis